MGRTPRGRHRKAPEAWRRWLLATLVGACLAMGVTVIGFPQGEHTAAPSFPVSMSLAVPTGRVSIPSTTPAPTATPPPTTTTTTTTTTVKPKPAPVVLPKVAACDSTGWGVKPAVARVGHHLAEKFGLKIGGILGLGGRVTSGSDHPKGLALDLMVFTNRALGDLIADYVLAHRVEFGVTYVIWRQRINQGSGWVAMENRGSITANHYDHVHVSFSPSSTANPTC